MCERQTGHQVSRCPPLRSGAALSGLAMSGLAISASPPPRHRCCCASFFRPAFSGFAVYAFDLMWLWCAVHCNKRSTSDCTSCWATMSSGFYPYAWCGRSLRPLKNRESFVKGADQNSLPLFFSLQSTLFNKTFLAIFTEQSTPLTKLLYFSFPPTFHSTTWTILLPRKGKSPKGKKGGELEFKSGGKLRLISIQDLGGTKSHWQRQQWSMLMLEQ